MTEQTVNKKQRLRIPNNGTILRCY